MIGLSVGHVQCALDHQRRIREARAQRAARMAVRSGRRRPPRGEPPPASDLRADLGEDVWQALRF